jgi:hypothetical protein
VVGPDRIGDDLAREPKAFQAEHGGRHNHCRALFDHGARNKLAMPFHAIGTIAAFRPDA